jgi:hypothetical protein
VRGAALRRVEVARQLEDCRLVERRLAVWISAGGEDEEGAADGGAVLVLREVDGLAGDVREDDGLYVSRSSTRLLGVFPPILARTAIFARAPVVPGTAVAAEERLVAFAPVLAGAAVVALTAVLA